LWTILTVIYIIIEKYINEEDEENDGDSNDEDFDLQDCLPFD
ncbi:17226_t:CDS:1, partial [Acaulospora colombiana]